MMLYGSGIRNPYGATSILIMVGVALETAKQIEALMLMRHYKGFLT
jgi:preprotein translocase subunit SecY